MQRQRLFSVQTYESHPEVRQFILDVRNNKSEVSLLKEHTRLVAKLIKAEPEQFLLIIVGHGSGVSALLLHGGGR